LLLFAVELRYPYLILLLIRLSESRFYNNVASTDRIIYSLAIYYKIKESC
jgi:hypothetical protein